MGAHFIPSVGSLDYSSRFHPRLDEQHHNSTHDDPDKKCSLYAHDLLASVGLIPLVPDQRIELADHVIAVCP